MSDPSQQDNDQTGLAILVTVLAAILVGKFTDAQLTLLGRFAKIIRRLGVHNPVLLRQLHVEAFAVVGQLQQEIPAAVEQVVQQASSAGAASAEHVVPKRLEAPVFKTGFTPVTGFESHADRSIRAIQEDLERKLNNLGMGVVRFADDVYRAVVADAAQAEIAGATPAEAQQGAYRRLTREGVSGFTDSRGRQWELSAYVEMATRTATQRAYNVSHLDRMQGIGIDLFTVTDDGHPCPLCQPWQGKILSVEPDARADATIAEATAAGLFHPNCRHTLLAFIPDVTNIPAPRPWTDDDARVYAESQQQRALERSVRAAKRELVGAFNPEQTAQANRDLRAAQARMRDFISQTGRVRIRRREQLNLGA